jgi:hypothetical protein
MITIGTDVEMFLGKDGSFVSAHDLIPGTKYDPLCGQTWCCSSGRCSSRD